MLQPVRVTGEGIAAGVGAVPAVVMLRSHAAGKRRS